MALPKIIQGGMGAGVSGWRLARAVSQAGQLGVVSGTALDAILVRRLQDGDPGGHMRRALAHFPFPEIARQIVDKFYIEGGKRPSDPYRELPMQTFDAPLQRQALSVAGNFAEIFLAREGHSNPVGMNYLEKIQMPLLPAIYGAMLAGVGYILMGAGIPLKAPGVLDAYVDHQPATYPLTVMGDASQEVTMRFDPAELGGASLPPLHRPQFLAIISSNVLAATMVKRANGRVDGFVVEGDTAGGHNAPPRGKLQLNERGEPVYGERDRVDLEALRALGLPFWLAGGYGWPDRLRDALDTGAAGVQVGTAFAYCAESGLRDDYKGALVRAASDGAADVFTDPVASPTGFPFKVARLAGTASEPDVYAERARTCNLGYLRQAYRTEQGKVDYRCAAESAEVYRAKGGRPEDAEGRKCLCNGLMANIGHPQVRHGYREPGLVTSGDDLNKLGRLVATAGLDYRAADVIAFLLGAENSAPVQQEQLAVSD